MSEAPLRAEWRSIGPYRGGRVVAVTGDPIEAHVFYFGSTGGGVWKTNDAGTYWENVSDGFFARASVGAIAVAPSDHNVLYVGMGEACIRNTVSHGDGVYRSTDGGATWRHCGLADTHHIGKVRIDPRDPEVVYVAAVGQASCPNEERGLYRSRDGGARWTRVLSRGSRAGAVDVAIDPTNPRVVYATTWEAFRHPWIISSGGPGSGLFRSSDSGDTWTEISASPGFPSGTLGRIGVAAAPRSGRLYAIVEAPEGGVYRSEDGGATWIRGASDRALSYRGYYYAHVVADPRDHDTVWVLNQDCWRSVDAGRTFERVATPHGDNHDLWIDPRDTRRMVVGTDGGAAITFNGGLSWSSIHNQPTAELYHVVADIRRPYRVYSAQQDCGTISLPSRSMWGVITPLESHDVGGGESGYVAVRPDDPDVAYSGQFSGYLTRYDHRTRQSRNIEVWPESQAWGAGARHVRHRWAWSFPILLSPHDPGTLYVAAERVFRSRDEGASWTAISPDLSRHDHARIDPPGTAITRKGAATERESAGTVFALAESTVTPGLLWAGTDDGRVHVRRDGSRRWTDVTPRAIEPWTLITSVEPSPHDGRVAYLGATRYLLGDVRPMAFRTRDRGQTWSAIADGLPPDEFVRVVREDPVRRGLLYAGTETGAYVSFDDGGAWHRLEGLPVVPVHDLLVVDDDLVAATHGRGFWILDDITWLRQDPLRARRAPFVFTPRPAVRYQTGGRYTKPPLAGHNYRIEGSTTVSWTPLVREGERTERFFGAGQNPPDGVVVRYRLPRAGSGPVTLRIRDASGSEIRSFYSGSPEPAPGDGPGLHRFVWDTRHAGPRALESSGGPRRSARGERGPFVPPGSYEVRIETAAGEASTEVEVHADPRTGATQADLEAQHTLLMRLRDATDRAHRIANEARAVLRTLDTSHGSARVLAPRRTLARIADAIAAADQTAPGGEVLVSPPRLSAKLTGLAAKVASADAAPTKAEYELAADLEREVDRLESEYTPAAAASGSGHNV